MNEVLDPSASDTLAVEEEASDMASTASEIRKDTSDRMLCGVERKSFCEDDGRWRGDLLLDDDDDGGAKAKTLWLADIARSNNMLADINAFTIVREWISIIVTSNSVGVGGDKDKR